MGGCQVGGGGEAVTLSRRHSNCIPADLSCFGHLTLAIYHPLTVCSTYIHDSFGSCAVSF